MIDIDTRKVVDILNSRDYQDVKSWLEEYPNIEVVSRDGSITYKKAINDAHSQAVQVSDRFHLLKNLTDYCKEFIKRTVKHRIEIESTTEKVMEINDVIEVKKKYTYQTKWELILVVRGMRSDGYTIDQICDVLGLGNKSVVKYSKIKDCDKEKYDKLSSTQSKQNNKRIQKEELIQEVKILKDKGFNGSQIARELNINKRTVKKYVQSNGSLIHATLGRTFNSKLDPYKEEIIKLLEERQTSLNIYDKIRTLGYAGSESLLRTFVSKTKKGNKPILKSNSEIVERKDTISLLYKDIEKVKSITTNQLEEIFKIYPVLNNIYNISREFKEVLFSNEAFKLDTWIEKCKELNISELNSFISGVERDIDAVKNAITYKYSNGLAEGTVNKIKVIKRIMYGRCSFELLRKKVLLNNFN
jgi:transposase